MKYWEFPGSYRDNLQYLWYWWNMSLKLRPRQMRQHSEGASNVLPCKKVAEIGVAYASPPGQFVPTASRRASLTTIHSHIHAHAFRHQWRQL